MCEQKEKKIKLAHRDLREETKAKRLRHSLTCGDVRWLLSELRLWIRRRSHLDLQSDPLKNLGDLRQHDIGERIHENVLIRCPQTEQNLSRGEKEKQGEMRIKLMDQWGRDGSAFNENGTPQSQWIHARGGVGNRPHWNVNVIE